jgi:outer membrane protein assembly factor BamA
MRMASVCVACAISCTAIAAGTLDHAQPNSSAERAMISRELASEEHPATKFVLSELKIEGDGLDRVGARDRVLKVLKSREYDNGKELGDDAAAGIRADFQERGFFQVVVHDPSSQPLGLADGKQAVLLIVSVTEGEQFRLGSVTIQSTAPDHPLNISAATIRDQFHLRNGDLFNRTEIGAGLERIRQLYVARGYASFSIEPDVKLDGVSHRIDLTIRIAEGPHTA